MSYVLDTDVFIRAWRDYYPFDYFPGWWEWLGILLARGQARIPEDVYRELIYPDDLTIWLDQVRARTPDCVIRRLEIPPGVQKDVSQMVCDKYDGVFAQRFLQKADYWVICSALSAGAVVVSLERRNTPSQSGGSKWRAEVKVPNVCDLLDIRCIGSFADLFKEIGGLRL